MLRRLVISILLGLWCFAGFGQGTARPSGAAGTSGPSGAAGTSGPQMIEKNQKLEASKIQAKMKRGQLPYYGLPERLDRPCLNTNFLCDWLFPSVVQCQAGIWTSMNLEIGLPNWVSWDILPGGMISGGTMDHFMDKIPAAKKFFSQAAWDSILSECHALAVDSMSPVTVVCGPLVTQAEVAKGKDAVPYEFFVCVCKKVKKGLGWQSIAFLLPNFAAEAPRGVYNLSASVNLVEYKSGYDFFRRLPSHLQELVEEMTTYELFSIFKEDEFYLEDPFETPDFQDALNDFYEDARDM